MQENIWRTSPRRFDLSALKRWSFGFPHSRFQIPGSRFRIPDSRFQIQIPDSGFQVPASGFQFPGSRFRVPGSTLRFQRTVPLGDINDHNSELLNCFAEARCLTPESSVLCYIEGQCGGVGKPSTSAKCGASSANAPGIRGWHVEKTHRTMPRSPRIPSPNTVQSNYQKMETRTSSPKIQVISVWTFMFYSFKYDM